MLSRFNTYIYILIPARLCTSHLNPLLPSKPSSVLLRRRNLVIQRQHMRQRPNRRNAQRVDLRVAPRVIPLDVVKLRRLLERRHRPVQISHPPVQRWVARPDVADVALEVLHVHGVEADQRYVSVVDG